MYDYQRDPESDPHMPHTLKHERRDTVELNLPPAAKQLLDDRWPELIRTIQQWDHSEGMLAMFITARDVTKAAGWPDNMAYQVRDMILSKLSDGKVKSNMGEKPFFQESKARRLIESDKKSEMMDETTMSVEGLRDMCLKAGLRVRPTSDGLRISNPVTRHWIELNLEEDPEAMEDTVLSLCRNFELEWQKQIGQHVE